MKELRLLFEFIGEHPLPFIGLGIGFILEEMLKNNKEEN